MMINYKLAIIGLILLALLTSCFSTKKGFEKMLSDYIGTNFTGILNSPVSSKNLKKIGTTEAHTKYLYQAPNTDCNIFWTVDKMNIVIDVTYTGNGCRQM